MTRVPSIFRTLVPPLAAVLYLACLVWQAPHTVHHFFERDAEKPNECALSATAERAPGATVEPVSLGVTIAIGPPVGVSVQPIVSFFGLELPAPRAPPLSAA